MRVLVTGGAGFIGSHVVDALVRDGHDVVVLDSLAPSVHACRPDYLQPQVEYRWGSLCDFDAVAAAVSGVDAVCHQASRVGLSVDFGDVVGYVADNDRGTATLLHALHERRFAGRTVLASSMAIYGEGAYRCAVHGTVRPPPRCAPDLDAGRFEPRCPRCGRDVKPEAICEDAPPDPRNVYAATKLHQEHLCAAYGRENGSTVIALRYHNVYGPRMPRDTPYAGVASIFRSEVAAGRPPRVHEDGAQLRDFVHVLDVARANLLALTADGVDSMVVNVSSGEPRSVAEMAASLATLGGGPPPVRSGRYRLGDVRHIFGSPHLALQLLEFVAEVSFADGMAAFATAPLREPARSWSGRRGHDGATGANAWTHTRDAGTRRPGAAK